jgi:acyl dehydratase
VRSWEAVREGFRFPTLDVSVDTERQRRHHRACDVPQGAFGGRADPSIFGHDTALAAVRAGLPLDGRIHLSCLLRQRRPVGLGERLSLDGRVLPFGTSPRGRLLAARFAFRDAAGASPLEMEMRYLLPGPPTGERPARAEEPRPEAFAPVGRLTLTPEKVKAYSAEAGNLIHFDPAFAQAAGFRAPLAQGQMQVTAALGWLARRGLPDAFAFDSRFLRPLFWDDDVRIEATADRRRLRFVARDGRIAGTAELRGEERDAQA